MCTFIGQTQENSPPRPRFQSRVLKFPILSGLMFANTVWERVVLRRHWGTENEDSLLKLLGIAKET